MNLGIPLDEATRFGQFGGQVGSRQEKEGVGVEILCLSEEASALRQLLKASSLRQIAREGRNTWEKSARTCGRRINV